MDVWFFIAKYIRPEWFQWTLTILIFLLFVILSQLSCLRPADINQFDRTMKGHEAEGEKGRPPGKNAPPSGPSNEGASAKASADNKKAKK
ncbi:hypothetical protein Efla_004145 [Eimeria flavescens]